MKAILSAVLIFLVSLTAAQAQNRNAGPGRGQVLRMHQIAVYDRQGWGQPVVAYTMLVPADWQVQADIVWNAQWHCMITDMIVAQLRIASPDGRYAFEAFPDYAGNWYEDPYMAQSYQQQVAAGQQVCPMVQPFNAGQFLTRIFLPGFRNGAQVVDVQQNPQAAQALYNEIMQSMGQVLQAQGGQVQTDAARMTIRHQGEEELVMATTSVTTMRGVSATAAVNGQIGYARYYTSDATKVVSFRAPPGELQAMEPVFSAMLGSIHVNPAWQAAVQQHMMTMQGIIQKGVADRAAIMRDAQNQIGDTIMRTWQNRQESEDRIAHSWSQTIRGTGDFIDPSTNTKVELPWGYDNVWSSGNGDYILSTVPGFNPNSDLQTNQNWTQMQAVH